MTIGCVSIKHISGRFLNKTKDLKASLKLLVVGKRGGAVIQCLPIIVCLQEN